MGLSTILSRLGLRKKRRSEKRAQEGPQLDELPRTACDVAALGRFDRAWLAEAWKATGWSTDGTIRDGVGFPEMTGGVNLGDQRALYQIVRALRPRRILEIGTHIGCSTACIALAARRNGEDGSQCSLDTVDVRDVNDEAVRPWVEYQSPASPREILKSIGLERMVTFHVHDSREWMRRTSNRYDLVFLDGNHAAPFVYEEIPLALSILAPGGMVVLHDYFPDGKPLWAGNAPIVGPWQAVDRFRREGCGFSVLPLGQLPWPTKLGSSTTSLAVLSAA